MRNLLLVALPATLVVLVVCELVFTFAVPASHYPKAFWDVKHKILRFDTEQFGYGVRTIGPFASRRTSWRINIQGWNSEIDFEQNRNHQPLIAVIGDSYVAGLEVDVDKAFVALLRRRLAGRFEVFGFGCPGRPLSTYLSMSRYVTEYSTPAMLVFVVQAVAKPHRHFFKVIMAQAN